MMRVWPFLVNELEPQYLLHDWRKVYECLAMFGIPIPRYGCVHREAPCRHLDYFVEEVDFVEVMGTAFGNLVEKPTVDRWERSISYLLLCSRCHASLPARGSHKVCVHSTLSKPYLWDFTGYVVVADATE